MDVIAQGLPAMSADQETLEWNIGIFLPEIAIANLVVWGKTFEVLRKVILQSMMLMVVGKLQIEGEVVHVIAESCHNTNRLLRIDMAARDIGWVHKAERAEKMAARRHRRICLGRGILSED